MDSRSSSKINYWFVPSLKHLTLVKLASSLCDLSDVRNAFSEKNSYDHGISKDDRLAVQRLVLKKVPKLQLPRILEKLLISYIDPVVFQILDWIDIHVVKYGYVTLTELPKEFEFFWTPQGNIDSKKVAQILVNDKRLDIYSRFELSCIYCLEEYIKDLSKILPEDFYKGKVFKEFADIWTYYLCKELRPQLHLIRTRMRLPLSSVVNFPSATFVEMGFKFSFAVGNEAATRYFLHRLTPEDRAKLLYTVTCAVCHWRKIALPNKVFFPENHFANNLFYLLSEMDEGEQTNLVTLCAFDVLLYLLIWPWQCFFLRTAKKVWRYLYPNDYYKLLQAISEKIFSETESMNYQGIFGAFWNLGSSAFKRHVIMNGGLKSLLPALIKMGDTECIKLIFNSTTVLEREKFIFCPTGQMICFTLIEAGKWELLKFFIQECILTKEVFWELKEKLIKALPCAVTIKKDSNMLNEFYQLLFDVEHEWKRKCIDDEVSSSTKKLHGSI